jgi:hypothetical protein
MRPREQRMREEQNGGSGELIVAKWLQGRAGTHVLQSLANEIEPRRR